MGIMKYAESVKRFSHIFEGENMLREYKISEIEKLKIHGRRTACLDPLTLFWNGSGIEMNVRATVVKIRCYADYSVFEPWIDVLVEGVRYQKRPLEKGINEITIWQGNAGPGESDIPLRNIKIIRDTPAMAADGDTLIRIESVITDGTFENVDEPGHRIEFIGDSITSGEGCMGPVCEQDWNSACFDAFDNYTYMTSQKLGADYEVFSQSGYGFMWSWYGNPKENMPSFYDEVCGLVPAGKACEIGAHEKYDFSLFEPDIVIINMGTNDAGAYSASSHEAARSMGFDDVHFLNEKGEIPPEDVATLKNGAKAFLKKVREKRPGAIIIWAYGMLLQDSDSINSQMTSLLSEAVSEYSKQENDSKVYYHQLPPTLAGEFGSRSHPGHAAHKKAAESLVKKIEAVLGVR